MTPLIEMMKQSGNGQAMEAVARQFGITPEQTEAAMEALMPAFSQGLKRNASDPMGFANFMQALSNGHHVNYFEHPEQAMSREGMMEGNAILGHLFGSKEVSRAVADQAAHMTGLSQSIIKQMLPTLAPMILGGLFKQMNGGTSKTSTGNQSNPLGWILEQMAGSASPRTAPGGDNPFGKMMEEMLRGTQGQRSSKPSAGANPWGDLLEQMMGGGQSDSSRERGSLPYGDNPLGKIFQDMMRGGTQSGMRPPELDPQPEPGFEESTREPEPQRRGGGLEDLFGEMFNTGRKVQNDYQKQMESIFDQFLDGKRR